MGQQGAQWAIPVPAAPAEAVAAGAATDEAIGVVGPVSACSL
jgi:hypothetical protein